MATFDDADDNPDNHDELLAVSPHHWVRIKDTTVEMASILCLLLLSLSVTTQPSIVIGTFSSSSSNRNLTATPMASSSQEDIGRLYIYSSLPFFQVCPCLVWMRFLHGLFRRLFKGVKQNRDIEDRLPGNIRNGGNVRRFPCLHKYSELKSRLVHRRTVPSTGSFRH